MFTRSIQSTYVQLCYLMIVLLIKEERSNLKEQIKYLGDILPSIYLAMAQNVLSWQGQGHSSRSSINVIKVPSVCHWAMLSRPIHKKFDGVVIDFVLQWSKDERRKKKNQAMKASKFNIDFDWISRCIMSLQSEMKTLLLNEFAGKSYLRFTQPFLPSPPKQVTQTQYCPKQTHTL